MKISNKSKDIDIKNRTYYFFNDIKIENKMQIILKQMKSDTKIFLFTILDMSQSKIRNTQKIYGVNPLYLILSKVNKYFEEINECNYLALGPTIKIKEKIKK